MADTTSTHSTNSTNSATSAITASSTTDALPSDDTDPASNLPLCGPPLPWDCSILDNVLKEPGAPDAPGANGAIGAVGNWKPAMADPGSAALPPFVPSASASDGYRTMAGSPTLVARAGSGGSGFDALDMASIAVSGLVLALLVGVFVMAFTRGRARSRKRLREEY